MSITTDATYDAFDPQGDGLTPSQRAQRDAALQRLDAALVGVSPDLAALARAVVEQGFYSSLHLDNNTRQYVIAQREALLDDITPPLKTIDAGLSVTMTLITRLADRVGDPRPDDPRSVMARLQAAEEARGRLEARQKATFLLVALALLLGIAAIAIAVLLLPAIAAILSGSVVALSAYVGARLAGVALLL